VHGNIIASKGRRRPIDNHRNSWPKRLQRAHYFYFLRSGCCTYTITIIIIWRVLYLALRTLPVLVRVVQRARREKFENVILPSTSNERSSITRRAPSSSCDTHTPYSGAPVETAGKHSIVKNRPARHTAAPTHNDISFPGTVVFIIRKPLSPPPPLFYNISMRDAQNDNATRRWAG